MLFLFGLGKIGFLVCSTLKSEFISCGLSVFRWEVFPFRHIKLFTASGFWLLMNLNEIFCRAHLCFLGRSAGSFSRKCSFPILVRCGSLQCYLPSDLSAETSHICCKRNHSTFPSCSCLLYCSEVGISCFLHFLSNFSWQYTVLLPNVVKPVCSACMWHK